VFNRFIAYRDKKVVGALCVFRAPLQLLSSKFGQKALIEEEDN
jgi:hypothetical protein